jgi:hypothetical protein
MAERFLIASGTSKYAALTGMDRPVLQQAVQSVVQLFTSLGYKRVLDAVGANPSSADLKKQLNRWLGDPQRDPSDWVVFYYTGHGELDSANQFYLLTADSETGDRANTQISMQQIAAMLLDTDAAGRNRRVRRMLFIIDACNAGAAAATITTNLFASFLSQQQDITIAILAAAFPNQEAFAGGLARALTEAIEDEALGGAKQEFLFFEGDLVPAIKKRLRGQKPLYALIMSADAPQFIPNPRYRPEALPPVGGASPDRTILTGFTGRTAALDRVSGWLDSTGDQRTTLVTGSPGSGKSALLLKAVTLGGPKFRPRVSARKPSPGLALHARGKTSSDVLGSLSGSVANAEPAIW